MVSAFVSLAIVIVGVTLLYVLLMVVAVILLTAASIKLDDVKRERRHLQRR